MRGGNVRKSGSWGTTQEIQLEASDQSDLDFCTISWNLNAAEPVLKLVSWTEEGRALRQRPQASFLPRARQREDGHSVTAQGREGAAAKGRPGIKSPSSAEQETGADLFISWAFRVPTSTTTTKPNVFLPSCAPVANIAILKDAAFKPIKHISLAKVRIWSLFSFLKKRKKFWGMTLIYIWRKYEKFMKINQRLILRFWSQREVSKGSAFSCKISQTSRMVCHICSPAYRYSIAN